MTFNVSPVATEAGYAGEFGDSGTDLGFLATHGTWEN